MFWRWSLFFFVYFCNGFCGPVVPQTNETIYRVYSNGLFLSLLCLHRDVLGVEYLTDDMDGAGEDLRVNKGSSVDKSRSNYRKQDRKYRQMNADTFNDGDGCDED